MRGPSFRAQIDRWVQWVRRCLFRLFLIGYEAAGHCVNSSLRASGAGSVRSEGAVLAPAAGHPAFISWRADDIEDIGQVAQVSINQIAIRVLTPIVRGRPRRI